MRRQFVDVFLVAILGFRGDEVGVVQQQGEAVAGGPGGECLRGRAFPGAAGPGQDGAVMGGERGAAFVMPLSQY